MAVVLQVVADDESGAELASAPAADALSGAEGFEGDAVAENDEVAAPDGAASDGVGEVGGEAWIIEQFGFDVFEVGAGLEFGVGDDPDIFFTVFDGGAEGDGESADGGFGGAAGAEDVDFGTAAGLCGVELIGHPAVHDRRCEGEMMGEVFSCPGEEVDDLGAGVQATGLCMIGGKALAELANNALNDGVGDAFVGSAIVNEWHCLAAPRESVEAG